MKEEIEQANRWRTRRKEIEFISHAKEVIDEIDNIEENEDDEMMDSDLEALEDEIEQILSPEEIMGLMEEQIIQLQDRAQYLEELNADVLEFTSFLMEDLEKSPDLNLKKSKQKLRALETRAGREIFWLKSRRL